ncbi:MAG: RIP metalloprotease RseP [Verrucomicrobiota bacterium]
MSTLLYLLNFLFVLLEVVVLFNAIIIAHEWGHFLAARWRGLKIEEFGVWFGKPLWKKEINGVLYSLGTIPAGGFVKLPQLAPMDIIEGEADVPRETLPSISALDKTIVAFAGPLFSFLLAVVLACGVYWVGKPVSEQEKTTTIGYVEPGSPAEKAGLQPGDRILAVDGHKVRRFVGMINSVVWFVVRSEGDKIPFQIERNGQTLTLESGWTKETRKGWQRSGLREVQILPALPTQIKSVEPGSPAAEAGLRPGDTISYVNGQRIFTPAVLALAIEKAPTAPVQLTIERGAQRLNFSIQPRPLPSEEGAQRPRIGIEWDRKITLAHPTPTQQIVDSATSIVNMIDALISPKSDVKAQHFSGPVGIGRIYYAMFQSEHGWRMALAFSVFFNVNLALLNLLPFPVLDGGHIVIAIIESIRRKPVNLRVLETVQSACALLLIGFILYVTFFDVQDLPWRKLVHEKEAPAATGK